MILERLTRDQLRPTRLIQEIIPQRRFNTPVQQFRLSQSTEDIIQARVKTIVNEILDVCFTNQSNKIKIEVDGNLTIEENRKIYAQLNELRTKINSRVYFKITPTTAPLDIIVNFNELSVDRDRDQREINWFEQTFGPFNQDYPSNRLEVYNHINTPNRRTPTNNSTDVTPI